MIKLKLIQQKQKIIFKIKILVILEVILKNILTLMITTILNVNWEKLAKIKKNK
jgi:hypothetical protein